jgi:hypothetical protein
MHVKYTGTENHGSLLLGRSKRKTLRNCLEYLHVSRYKMASFPVMPMSMVGPASFDMVFNAEKFIQQHAPANAASRRIGHTQEEFTHALTVLTGLDEETDTARSSGGPDSGPQ